MVYCIAFGKRTHTHIYIIYTTGSICCIFCRYTLSQQSMPRIAALHSRLVLTFQHQPEPVTQRALMYVMHFQNDDLTAKKQ